MQVQSKVIVKAIQTKNKEFILITDPRVKFVADNYFGDHYEVDLSADRGYDSGEYRSLIDVAYDVKTHSISPLEIVEYKPQASELFVVGKQYLHESEQMYSTRKLERSTLEDIVYEEYEQLVNTGKYFKREYLHTVKDFRLQDELTYCLRIYKPTYLFKDGFKTEYEHQLFTI